MVCCCELTGACAGSVLILSCCSSCPSLSLSDELETLPDLEEEEEDEEEEDEEELELERVLLSGGITWSGSGVGLLEVIGERESGRTDNVLVGAS